MRWRRDRHDRELADEMALHLELRAERLRDAGLSVNDARDAATRRFGNVTLLRELSRDAWGWPRLETVCQDFRHAVRVAWKNPAFSAAVIMTMALGIGANTAVFALLHGLLLRPTPVADPERLVLLEASSWTSFTTFSLADMPTSANPPEAVGGFPNQEDPVVMEHRTADIDFGVA